MSKICMYGQKLSARGSFLKNFLASRMPGCRTFSTSVRLKLHKHGLNVIKNMITATEKRAREGTGEVLHKGQIWCYRFGRLSLLQKFKKTQESHMIWMLCWYCGVTVFWYDDNHCAMNIYVRRHSRTQCSAVLYRGTESIAIRKLRIIIPCRVCITICKEERQQQYSYGKHLISFPSK